LVTLHRRLRIALSLAALVAGAALGGAAAFASGGSGTTGWTLRVSVGSGFTALDPAAYPGTAFTPIEWALCANLYNYPDQGGSRGGRLEPEVAAGPPLVSRNGRSYTFTIRRGFRFDNGAPVGAANFAAAINRDLNPRLRSPAADFLRDVVGAQRVIGGTAVTASGVRTRGDRLSITLTRRAPDLVARLAMSYFCAIPTGTAADPKGVTPASAGPYYVAHLDQKTLVMKRNKFYGGHRPRNPAKIVWSLYQPFDSIALEVERGNADYGLISPAATSVVAKQYPSQFHVGPGMGVLCLALNNSRPLFHDNPQLRKAVNYAIDRRALAAQFGYFVSRRLTDQYLPPAIRGFRDAHIYPLSRPNFKKARALAKGHTGTGQAIMYIRNASTTALDRAQIVQYDLKQIGISVEIRQQTPQHNPANANEPFDIVDSGCYFPSPYLDPYPLLNLSFDGNLIRPAGNTNFAYFDNRRFNKRLEAAAKLRGAKRYRTYGKLDVDLARQAAPAAAYALFQYTAFVSKRVGCVKLNPINGFSFGAVCLKRRG
jgi:peptide/nickel transport system substrate-binding protein